MSVAPLRLGVLGDPIGHSRSPQLHRAALAALGIEGDSEAIETPAGALGPRLTALAEAGYRGVNLTHPLKREALEHLPRVSERAREARSVNTVGFDRDGWWGETTDGSGFLDLLASLGREAAAERVALLGAGGAARSLALALRAAGARIVAVSARRPEASAPDWGGIPDSPLRAWRSPEERAALSGATLVVNCAPISGSDLPLPMAWMPAGAMGIDLTYGDSPSHWVWRLREAGHPAFDGLGLLVHQARRSLELWLGREVPVEPLARAVGWPR